MNPADLLVAGIIVLVIASAIIVLVAEKRSGKSCYGCKCCCKQPQIIEINDEKH